MRLELPERIKFNKGRIGRNIEVTTNTEIYWVYDGEKFHLETKEPKENNMTGKLYWVVLVTHPTKAEKDDGACSAVTKGPELVCAKTENDAVVLATARWHENIVLKRTEVIVVPFE